MFKTIVAHLLKSERFWEEQKWQYNGHGFPSRSHWKTEQKYITYCELKHIVSPIWPYQSNSHLWLQQVLQTALLRPVQIRCQNIPSEKRKMRNHKLSLDAKW